MPTLRKRDEDMTTGWDLGEFHQPVRPSEEPPYMPEDLGELDDSTLMEYFNTFTRWSSYLDTVMTEKEIEEDDAETVLNQAESAYLITVTEGSGVGIQLARVKMSTDEHIQALRACLSLARARRKRLAAHLRDVQRSANFLSRELTRRTSSAPYDRRKTGY
jgi:hypothetical protein